MVSSNCDFPQIIINSIPGKELVFKNIAKDDLKEYIDGVKKLQNCGASFIVMICNTIHLFHSQLEGFVSVPILDLKEEVGRYLWRKGL